MVALERVLRQAEQERKVDKAMWHCRRDRRSTAQASSNVTSSSPVARAKTLLENWDESRRQFVKVLPTEYKRALGEMAAKKANKEVLAA